MIRIALCDDNTFFLKKMLKLLQQEFEKHTHDYEICDYTSGNLLLIHHKEIPFDVIFLDIDMPQMTGFELAKQLQEISENCYIVFITSHSELVYDSFYFQPLNFITKGDEQWLLNKLTTVMHQLFQKMKSDKILILEDKNSGRISTYLKDVLYIESNKHYVIYHIENKRSVQIRESINRLEDELSDFDFVRIHKKYLVNLRHVYNIDKINDSVIFKQNLQLPMSRNYKSAVDEKLTQYLRRVK